MTSTTAVDIAKKASFDRFAGQHIYRDRVAPTVALASKMRVLNVGCAGSDALTSTNPVHYKIAKVADYCVGIDIFEEGVQRFQRDGYNTLVADAERFDLPDKNFDLAILGDVIEHVANPGLVFDSINRHLIIGGRAVVTTPNPFALSILVRRTFGMQYVGNSEHVAWFDPILLSYLMERSGFGDFEVFWADQSRAAPLRWIQKRVKNFNNTFGIIGTKIRDI